MKTKLFILSLFIGFSLFAQKIQWKTSYQNIDKEVVPENRMPSQYKSYVIDFEQIRNHLLQAPDFKSAIDSNIILSIPDDKGQLVDFKIYQSGTLSTDLQKNTGIRTYRGVSLNGQAEIASIVTSMFGLHIGILRPGKPDLILEPSSKDLQQVIVFAKKNLPPVNFQCFVDENNTLPIDLHKSSPKIDDEVLRTYRFAVGTTAEYSQYHINRAINLGVIDANATDAQKKDVVLAAVTVTIDRLNSVYIRDFGVMLELVPNEREVIFLDPNTDPYDNSDIISMLNNNTTVLNDHIGVNNYDGGHLFTTYPGGGISHLGCICTSVKGRSVTGLQQPIGDGYDIDFVAHEVGHAFNCNHTFGNSCNNNRSLSTAMEPGSGSTIMGYAGVCSPNVQIHSDDYFHVISIAEASNFISNTATCSINTNIGNQAPVITVTRYNNSIPKETPFMLTATAQDANAGDALTYCWEEIDQVTDSNIINWVPNATYTHGPMFRSYDPKTTGVRYFPSMVSVLNNTYGNTWEKLPGVNRTMNFAITVRDNHVGGGQTPNDYVSISVDANAGPFRITNMSNGETWNAGDTKTITWDVAGTDGNNVNCTSVDILFSADNGVTFPYVVAQNIPNNGSAQFNVPNFENTALGRFMVKGHNNYFFDVAKGRFNIQNVGAVTQNNLQSLHVYPNPTKNQVTISFDLKSGNKTVYIKLYDISGREVYSQIFESGDHFNQNISLNNLNKGIYFLNITNGKDKAVEKLILQ